MEDDALLGDLTSKRFSVDQVARELGRTRKAILTRLKMAEHISNYKMHREWSNAKKEKCPTDLMIKTLSAAASDGRWTGNPTLDLF